MHYYFITGTSRGLGKALSQKILSEGNAKVIGIGRSSTLINPNYKHFNVDLKDVHQLESVLEGIFTRLIDPEKVVLINNSGTLGEVGYAGETTAENIINVVNVNSIAPAILMNSFLKKYGKLTCPKTIINISSGAGKNAIDGWSNYCTSKAALDMYSRVVASEQELRQQNTSIYSIAPGIIDTKMQDHIRKADQEDFSMIQRFKDYKQNGDLSSPQEVAEKFWYFLQHEGEFEDVLLDVRNF